MKILLFGQLKERLNADYIVIDHVVNSDKLMTRLLADYPSLADVSFRLAVDKNIVTEKVDLQENSEIALLPPFSGG